MPIGLVLPTGAAAWNDGADPRALLTFATRAEELGFDSLWAGDTLLRPVIEPFTTLTAVAAVTSRIGLGTAALLPALRRPVQAAQTIASLDLLSGGRLTLAVGAGFPKRSEAEYALSDVPWPGRFRRLDETVTSWRRLWSGTAPGLPEQLRTTHPGGPPIWLGGASPAALERAGRLYDGWLPYPPDPADYQSGLAAVRRSAADSGRDPAAITPALYATVLVADDRRALADYVERSYRMPLEVIETIQLLIVGPPEKIAAELDRYAGAHHLVLRIGAIGLGAQLNQLEQLAALLG